MADTKVYPLPEGMITRFELAEDALACWNTSLTWVAKLAEGYAAPFETTS